MYPSEVALPQAQSLALTLTPIAVTLVGQLDDVLVDAFAEVLQDMAARGPRPLILDVSDLVAMRGDAADRIVGLLTALSAAGVDVSVEVGSSGWRKLLTAAGVASHAPDPVQRASAKRRFIIARSSEHAA